MQIFCFSALNKSFLQYFLKELEENPKHVIVDFSPRFVLKKYDNLSTSIYKKF